MWFFTISFAISGCFISLSHCSTQSYDDIITCSGCCQDKLEIKYSNGLTAEPGVEVKPSQVVEEPKISWQGETQTLYTLFMIDPDAPSRANPVKRDWRHWLVVNIPGSDISKGNTVSIYKGPGPPKDTGFHRYIFLIYPQPEAINATSLGLDSSPGSRASFDTQKFVKDHNLKDPIWCNVFKSKFEEPKST